MLRGLRRGAGEGRSLTTPRSTSVLDRLRRSVARLVPVGLVSALLFTLGLVLVLVLGGCAGGNAASRLAEAPAFEPKGQTKCGVTKNQARPLIVEWPSADRGALEAQTKRGVIVVRYEGCEMEVLRQCRAKGKYVYAPVTRKEDHIAIRNADELYASIPAHAAQFEGKLKASGQLDVQMTIVGTYEADQAVVRFDELEGDCRKATHVILGISAGAFEFSAASGAEVKAGASGLGLATGGDSTASRELLNRDGYRSACERSTNTDTAPPDGCGALLRVEVVPLSAPQPVAVAPAALPYFFAPPAGFAPPPPPPPPPREREPRGAYNITGILATTVGSVGLAVGAVAGSVALGQKGSLNSACTDGHCGPSESGTLDGYHTSTTLASVGFIGGGALLLGGIIMLATSPSRPFKKEPSSAWIAPSVGPGGLGAVGAF